MSDTFPVLVAVKRPDGSTENVRVGSAVREGDAFVLSLGTLSIGTTPEAPRRAPVAAASGGGGGGGGDVFPPYGRSKGAPVRGATKGDLEYYANGCRRSLDDASKSRWHEKERQLLDAIEAELARQGGGGESDTANYGGPSRGAPAPADYGGYGSPSRGSSSPPDRGDDTPPPFTDDDIPF